jgi:predicted helicase
MIRENGRQVMSEAVLRSYLTNIETPYKTGNATEHTYRPALQKLLVSLVSDITALNEPKRIKCGAPDYAVFRRTGQGLLTIGYVEAKDISIPLDKIEHGEQMNRYLRALDNLVLTDYLEFRWYVKGEKQMSARLTTLQRGKSLTLDKVGAKATEDLLQSFLRHNAETIRNPADLAKRMARLAHMIRDVTVAAFEYNEASDTLNGLYEAFKTVLIPDLPTTQFADMFAQTLAYGLFAARYNHQGPELFNRRDAAREIPRTNPFLRKLFGTIAASDFEDEPFIGFVNELTQVLGVTDMNAVLAGFGKRTRQEDPIVHFYETFLTQYDPKLREVRGVYYTPEPVVSYIVRSVDHLLREQFDCPDGLADTSTITTTYTDEEGKTQTEHTPRVLLLDPACGTGTFLYAIVDQIRESYRKMGNAGMWSSYVRDHLLQRIFGFELLMAPYAVAHLKLGMQLAALDLPMNERSMWEYDFETEERLGLYLTNTLEHVLRRSNLLLGTFISDEANEAARVKQDCPVMVIIGNPPYSGHSANKGKWISGLLHGEDDKTGRKIGNYFEVDGKPLGERNPKWLNDDYVKFIRFAQWRIEKTGYGILAFITNHGYLDNPTFRGMRRSLMQSFDDIYILDLHGNSNKRERSPDGTKDENVFDIQQGVAIGVFVKRLVRTNQFANIYHAHLWGQREADQQLEEVQRVIVSKYQWLAENDIQTTKWIKLEPQSPFYLFIPQDNILKEEYEQGWRITDVFSINTVGVVTGQDAKTVAPTLAGAEELAKSHNLPRDIIKTILYRPFDLQFITYSKQVVTRPRSEVMQHMVTGKNIALIFMRQVALHDKYSHFLVTSNLVDNRSMFSNKGIMSMSPLYLYPDTNKKGLFDTNMSSNAPGGRTPNLAPAFTVNMAKRLNMEFILDGKGDLQQTFGPEDVLDYIYAIFCSPIYRTRYTDFLKIDFPRLPITSDSNLFRVLCNLGEQLVGLHLMDNFGKALPKYPIKGNNLVEKIEYLEPKDLREQGQVSINKTQYFDGVPSEVWNFHIGGYQVCHKWLKDRKGRTLSFDDVLHYQRIVSILGETIQIMEQIDETIEEHGGWPLG